MRRTATVWRQRATAAVALGRGGRLAGMQPQAKPLSLLFKKSVLSGPTLAVEPRTRGGAEVNACDDYRRRPLVLAGAKGYPCTARSIQLCSIVARSALPTKACRSVRSTSTIVSESPACRAASRAGAVKPFHATKMPKVARP